MRTIALPVLCTGELMKELECSQDFSHYKSMGIFPDAQGQLTPQHTCDTSEKTNREIFFSK